MSESRRLTRLLRSRRTRLALAVLALPPVLLALYVFLAPLPAPESRMHPAGTVVLGSDGTVLRRDTSEGLRIPVSLDQVAPAIIDATIAAEDQRFESHVGIDPLALARAAFTWWRNPSGASTITQQLARRLYLRDAGGPRLWRKARESVLALQLERRRSKDEILALYLNEIYYGRGAYGAEAAARVYFDTSARNLDLAQAAFLAGLPQLPSSYEPAAEIAPAQARQRYVLDRLVATGKVSRPQASAAAAEPLVLAPALAPTLAPHAVQYALDELARLRPDLAGRDGLIIETTIDPALEAETERLARLRLDEIKDRDATNASVVVLDPRTGAILTLMGSVDFNDLAIDGQVNVALQARQPGSALKPFLYAAAFERGYTAATPLLDVPTTFDTPSGPYSPLDYDRRFHGVVPLRVALASSYNIPAVRTLDAIGIDAFLEMAHRAGLHTLTDTEAYGLALTLGGGDVRLLDLAAAYGIFATEGLRTDPYIVSRVRDSSGRVLYERPSPVATRVLSEQNAWLIADILADPAARVPGFGEVNPLTVPFTAGVKTGTTTGFRDNWTVGFTANRVVGVWVGNTDGHPMRDVSGVDGAGPIWRDVMIAAGERFAPEWLTRPAGLVTAAVCPPTGLLPGPDCPGTVQETFVAGTEPRVAEQYFVRDSQGMLRADVPAGARAWAVDAGVAVAGAGAPGSSAPPSLQVVQPVRGSVLFMSPELPTQQLLLRATAAMPVAWIELRVDGAVAGRSDAPDVSIAWRLEPGAHAIEATAGLPGGETVTTTSTYEVRTR